MRFKNPQNHALATVAHSPENLAHDSDFPSKHMLSHNPAFFETRAHISSFPFGREHPTCHSAAIGEFILIPAAGKFGTDNPLCRSIIRSTPSYTPP